MDCIFCRIIEGKIPVQKVHESERFTAVLDINPIAPGHTLVIPREHHETLTDLPSELALELVSRSQDIARAVVKAMESDGFNYLINNHKCAGQAIPHVHAHIIPRKTGDGVRFNWNSKPAPTEELEKTAEAIREALK